MILKNFRSISLMLILFSFIFTNIYCQDWNNIDDSTYNSIVKNRFAKGNIIIGFGGTYKIDYGNYKTVVFGIRSQVGYFIANQWLLSGYFDVYNSCIKQDSTGETASYFRVFAGPSLRYYFKPKSRTIFCQVSAFAGNENQKSQNVSEFDNFNSTMFGGSIALGLSAFIRRIELELLTGIKIYSGSYENAISSSIFMQINFSYIFDKINKPHKTQTSNY
jgi:hypothetical protein